MSRYIDLIGQRYGRLVVAARVPSKHGKTMFECLCDCGNSTVVSSNNLRRGRVESCGCLLREKINKHGMARSRIYRIYMAIKGRCTNINSPQYKYYGERGISMCNEWLNSFQTFYDWAMTNGYRDDLTIDRIDNERDYSPDNCRWVTMQEQSENKRSNKTIVFNGKSQTLSQWARELGFPKQTLIARITTYKWSIEKALTTPLTVRKRRANDGKAPS